MIRPVVQAPGERRMAGALGALVLLAALAAPEQLVFATVQDPAGRWELAVEWPRGATSVTLTISREGGRLAVLWQGPQGELDASEVSFEDGVLTFVLTVETPSDGSVELRYRGTVREDTLTGTLRTPRDAEIPASGTRSGS